MQLFGLNRRRSETLLLAIGQLVLIAYVFQVAALDHWHTNPADAVVGVPGSSAHSAIHADHCHGGPASCAEAGGGFAQFSADQTVRLPSSAPLLVVAIHSRSSEPSEPYIGLLAEPPRAS